jgi:hypothetical protein
MTAALILFLLVSNVISWFFIGTHASTMKAHRKNNIRMWDSLQKAHEGQVKLWQEIRMMMGDISHHVGHHNRLYDMVKKAQERLDAQSQRISACWEFVEKMEEEKKPSQKVKITRK